MRGGTSGRRLRVVEDLRLASPENLDEQIKAAADAPGRGRLVWPKSKGECRLDARAAAARSPQQRFQQHSRSSREAVTIFRYAKPSAAASVGKRRWQLAHAQMKRNLLFAGKRG